jgi:hypothetical protein
MYPSSTLCRTQEEFHRARAAEATLDNVRAVAASAALAWGQEALAAERREARGARARAIADRAALQKRQAADAAAAEEPGPGENPDRELGIPWAPAVAG